MAKEFYWRINRDSVITPTAIRMFQILSKYDGQDFDQSKDAVDQEYLTAVGRDEARRHGGIIQTQIRAFQEAGWVELEQYATDKKRIKVTDAGKQASLLLGKLPDFLKVIPYFVIELLTRYQLNNPARPETTHDTEYDAILAQSNIFPYWTLYKIMRESDSYITSSELKRFVFRIKKTEEIPSVIQAIKEYRNDLKNGLAPEVLDKKYPLELEGAISEPKYVMGRLGTQVGKYPPVIEKEGQSKWIINPSYLPFVDEVIKDEPIFKEYLTEQSWMAEHGQSIVFWDELISRDLEQEDDSLLEDELPDDDPIWQQTKSLLAHGASGVLYSGPPGTSKTWYASRIAAKLANRKSKCVKQIQFHPSFSYDDFVEGYIPTGKISSDSGSLFEVVDKIFLKVAGQAKDDPQNTYVIVIDEFSRGDPSRIFGEVLTYIEKDYRNKKFVLPYSGKSRAIPGNVVILGTMNPYDKSVSDLDAAMERRFEIVALEPNVETLKKLVTAAGMSPELMGKAVGFFADANKKCPHGFGHTYFLNVKDEEDLKRLWNHKLRFTFEKMFRFEQHVYQDLKAAYSKLVVKPDELL